MTNVTLISALPMKKSFFDLFLTTGWNKKYKFSKEELYQSIRYHWFRQVAYIDDKLVGYGGIISDGIYHALIVDLIISPEYQGQGLGGLILEKLLDHCLTHEVRDVQLFSSEGTASFYEKFHFKARSSQAPGMQFKHPD